MDGFLCRVDLQSRTCDSFVADDSSNFQIISYLRSFYFLVIERDDLTFNRNPYMIVDKDIVNMYNDHDDIHVEFVAPKNIQQQNMRPKTKLFLNFE